MKWCLTWYSDFVAEMVVVESIKSCRELTPDSSQHNKFWFSLVLITFIRTINLSQNCFTITITTTSIIRNFPTEFSSDSRVHA